MFDLVSDQLDDIIVLNFPSTWVHYVSFIFDHDKYALHFFFTRSLDSNCPKSASLSNQVVFVPDYNVSVAEVLIPGSELSQHIR